MNPNAHERSTEYTHKENPNQQRYDEQGSRWQIDEIITCLIAGFYVIIDT